MSPSEDGSEFYRCSVSRERPVYWTVSGFPWRGAHARHGSDVPRLPSPRRQSRRRRPWAISPSRRRWRRKRQGAGDQGASTLHPRYSFAEASSLHTRLTSPGPLSVAGPGEGRRKDRAWGWGPGGGVQSDVGRRSQRCFSRDPPEPHPWQGPDSLGPPVPRRREGQGAPGGKGEQGRAREAGSG